MWRTVLTDAVRNAAVPEEVETLDDFERRARLVVKHPTRDTGQVDWWSNSRPATQVRLSDGQTVKHPTRDTGQAEWWWNSRPATQVRWWNTRPATQVRFAKNESPSTKYTA